MHGRDSHSDLHRSEGRRLFGLDPAGYSAGRPDYPEAVYETLARRCGLGPTTQVLEIGPGTGLVTRPLLREVAHVTAVEPDLSMASYLRDAAASANLDVVPSSFEEADVGRARFDLAVAATSFHWVDQEVGLSKLGHTLRPGGWATLWWTLSTIRINQTSSARPSSRSWDRPPAGPLTNRAVRHFSSTSRTGGATWLVGPDSMTSRAR